MNVVFFALVAIAFLFAGVTGSMGAATQAVIDSAAQAVTLALGLVGIMSLFLGLMQVLQEAGALRFMARIIRPVMVRLFPSVPADHPAMGAMIMNLSANALGLANAATPFGIRAMEELDRLNGRKGTATNAMALFLAINTSAVTLLPTGVIGLRAASGSADAAGILPTTLFASACSTVVGVSAALLLARLSWFARTEPPVAVDDGARDGDAPPLEDQSAGAAGGLLPLALVMLGLGLLVFLAVRYGQAVSDWIIPTLVLGMLTVGVVRKVKVYEVFIVGAKEGFNVALRIIPYLVAILVAVGLFRRSGALGFLVQWVGPLTEPLGLPAQALPMALLRPLSGSGAYGVMAEIISTEGPDTYVGYLVSTIQGSTETTFYVLAVYFGAVGILKVRHAILAALAADFAGVVGAVFICSVLYGDAPRDRSEVAPPGEEISVVDEEAAADPAPPAAAAADPAPPAAAAANPAPPAAAAANPAPPAEAPVEATEPAR